MTMSSLWCLARPDIEGYSYIDGSEAAGSYEVTEKKVNLSGDEDELPQRLSDLRMEISDAKVDW